MEQDPPYLTVGTEVSAKYKGAFCEAKIRKVVRNVKCKVTFKSGLGSTLLAYDQIKGIVRVGANVEARHPDKNAFIEAVVNKIQDCSQYTVVFDDGDITTLRRSALCLKSGRHFNESETLDQLPLTHPEHFSNPVMGGRRNIRRRRDPLSGDMGDDDSSDEESVLPAKKGRKKVIPEEADVDVGKVVCVELTDKKKAKDSWFPAVIVSPSQDSVKIRTKDECMVRSFKDGRYYTVPKKEVTSFSKDCHAVKNDTNTNVLKAAIDRALLFIDKNELPAHWDKDNLFSSGEEPVVATESAEPLEEPEFSDESEESEQEEVQPEEKDRFVAQLYKHMDDRGTPINKVPFVCNRELDFYKLYKIVVGKGGYNKVTNSSQWKSVTVKMGFGSMPSTSSINLVKQGYKKFIHTFEEFNRKLGCSFLPSTSVSSRSNRTIIRDRHASSSSRDAKKEELKAAATPPPAPSTNLPKEPNKEEIVKQPDPCEPSVLVAVGDGPTKLEEKAAAETPRRSRKPKVKHEVASEKEKSAVVKKRRSVRDKEEKDQNQSSIPENPPQPPPPPSIVTKRGFGRGKSKRKVEKDEPPEPKTEVEDYPPDRQFIGKDVEVQIGDKLSVYYGKESEGKKYEAKVIDIKEGQDLFYVHYAGWNTRYDEWIPRFRVAEHLTLRSTEPSAQATPVGSVTTCVSDSSSNNESGSGSSFKEPVPEKGKKKMKSNLPKSTKSLLTPRKRLSSEGDANVPTKRRGRKRGSLSGAESDGDSSEAEDKTTPLKRVRNRRRKKVVPLDSNTVNPAPSDVSTNLSKSIPSPDISDFSQDSPQKDTNQVIDLNQLRSEMKGIDRMITTPVLTNAPEPPPTIIPIPVQPLILTPSVSSVSNTTKSIYDFEEEQPSVSTASNTQALPVQLAVATESEQLTVEPEAKIQRDEVKTKVFEEEKELKLKPKESAIESCEVKKENATIVTVIENSVEAVQPILTVSVDKAPTTSAALLVKRPQQSPQLAISPRPLTRLPIIEPKIRTIIQTRTPIRVPPLLVRGAVPGQRTVQDHLTVRTITPISISIPQRTQRPILIQSPRPSLPITVTTPISSVQSQILVRTTAECVKKPMEPLKVGDKPFQLTATLKPNSSPSIALLSSETSKIKTSSTVEVLPKLIKSIKTPSYTPLTRLKPTTSTPSKAPGLTPFTPPAKKKRKMADPGAAIHSIQRGLKVNFLGSNILSVPPKVIPVKTSGQLGSTPSTSNPPKPMKVELIPMISSPNESMEKREYAPSRPIPIIKAKLPVKRLKATVKHPIKIDRGRKQGIKPIVPPPPVLKVTTIQPQQHSVIVKPQDLPISIQTPTPAAQLPHVMQKQEGREITNLALKSSAGLTKESCTLIVGRTTNIEPNMFYHGIGSMHDRLPIEMLSTIALAAGAREKLPEVNNDKTDDKGSKLVSENVKDVSVSYSLTLVPSAVIPAEEESCSSLLCEEEIPGSPTPGPDVKSFAFGENVQKTVSPTIALKDIITAAETMINSSLFSTSPRPLPNVLVEKYSAAGSPLSQKEGWTVTEGKPSASQLLAAIEEERESESAHKPLQEDTYRSDGDDHLGSYPRALSSTSSVCSDFPRVEDIEDRHSGSGENSKFKEQESDTDSMELSKANELVDDNSTSDEAENKYHERGEKKTSEEHQIRSRSPSTTPKKRVSARRPISPDESPRYRGSLRHSSLRRPVGNDATYGRMPSPQPPINMAPPPKSRFNLIPDLNGVEDGEKRIEILLASMDGIRAKYREIKSEITAIDKKRKRYRKRKRERERKEKEARASALASSAVTTNTTTSFVSSVASSTNNSTAGLHTSASESI